MRAKSREELLSTLTDGAANCLLAQCNAAREIVSLRKHGASPLYTKIELFTRENHERALKYDTVMRSDHADPARVSYEEQSREYKYVDGNALFQKILNPGAKQDYCLEGDVEEFLRAWGVDYRYTEPHPSGALFRSIVVMPIKGPRWSAPDSRTFPPKYAVQPFGVDKTLIGFISVDSPENNMFDEVDVNYLRNLACDVFEVLRLYCTAYSALQTMPANSNPLPLLAKSEEELSYHI